jgi:dihydrolipoamide dehydrogenase
VNYWLLGSGPGGYTAAFRASDLGKKVVMIERYSDIGGVCLNVGCIPSKALLHMSVVLNETKEMGAHGITFAEPKIDIDKIREFKDGVINN